MKYVWLAFAAIKWHSLFIHVKRYYTFLKLISESWSHRNFNEFETSLYIRTLYWSMYVYLPSIWYIWLHDPWTFNISLVILFTVCHTTYVMLGWRIWNWINQLSPNWYFSSFSLLVCLILYWWCKEKFSLGHQWD